MRKKRTTKKKTPRKRKTEEPPMIYVPPVLDPPVGGPIVWLNCSEERERIRRMYGLPPLSEEETEEAES